MPDRVPDTNNFSLRDVCDVVKQGVNTLDSCFEKANDNYFDSKYKGNKNSLYNFRNYGGDKEPAKILWTKGGRMYRTFRNNYHYQECSGAKRYEFYIGNDYDLKYRWYIEFDVSQITSCTEVELRIRYADKWWNKNWGKEVVQCTANSYNSPEMFNSYNPTNLIESGYVLTYSDEVPPDRYGANLKLTPYAVNLINSSSKLKLLVKVKDSDFLPNAKNQVKFSLGSDEPPILFITE